MTYTGLKRVKEIDAHITELHDSLQQLYKERALLVSKKGHTAAGNNSKEIYQVLAHIWLAAGLKLPSYSIVRKKLDKILELQQALEQGNRNLAGKTYVVAVPPFSQLEKLIGFTAPKFEFREDVLDKAMKSRVWSFILVFDLGFAQPVKGARRFIETREHFYNQYDCARLGVQELIAAEIQGVKVLPKNGWTLLFKDGLDGDEILCAERDGATVFFDIDDTDALLDDNYLIPAARA